MSAALAACGGGGGGGGGSAPPVTVTPPGGGTPTPTPPPTADACSVRATQEWVNGAMRANYLYPNLLAAPDYRINSVQEFIDALTKPAQDQNLDKPRFNFVTSASGEDALINSGASAGFGIVLRYDTADGRLFVREAYENAPAFAAGIDRGTEILAIGTTEADLRSVSSIFASGGGGDSGDDAVIRALGPSTAGTSRVLRFRTVDGQEFTRTVTKQSYSLDPVSDRNGVRILQDGNKRVGYLALRTFISREAEADLRQAFATFQAQGVTEVIIDLRYNGGGLVSVAILLANLLGGNRTSSDVLLKTVENSGTTPVFFNRQAQSIGATKIAFIGTDATASASELVMNAFLPYLGPNAALIGTNTSGKPVGQTAVDRGVCDQRARIIAFSTINRDNQGNYFDGIAPLFQRTCRAGDDLSRPLGDPNEASIRTALDFLGGRSCTPIAGATGIGTRSISARQVPLMSATPTPAQREIPGLF